jgi:hypothetical protein
MSGLPMRIAGKPPRERPVGQGSYAVILSWLFTAFNSVRVLAYLPTLWAIHVSGDSSQHSLWTWLTWLGANVTMAAWLYETNGRRFSRAALVNACNAAMCLLTVAFISAHRL